MGLVLDIICRSGQFAAIHVRAVRSDRLAYRCCENLVHLAATRGRIEVREVRNSWRSGGFMHW